MEGLRCEGNERSEMNCEFVVDALKTKRRGQSWGCTLWVGPHHANCGVSCSDSTANNHCWPLISCIQLAFSFHQSCSAVEKKFNDVQWLYKNYRRFHQIQVVYCDCTSPGNPDFGLKTHLFCEQIRVRSLCTCSPNSSAAETETYSSLNKLYLLTSALQMCFPHGIKFLMMINFQICITNQKRDWKKNDFSRRVVLENQLCSSRKQLSPRCLTFLS